jgi:hypothetical protein
MNICHKHLTELAKMLQRKGLGHLITEDPQKAAYKGRRWLRGNARPQDFDPQVVATLEIYQKVTSMGYAPTGCALCAVPALLRVASADAHWIDNVTDAMVVVAQVNGLMRGGVNQQRIVVPVSYHGHA